MDKSSNIFYHVNHKILNILHLLYPMHILLYNIWLFFSLCNHHFPFKCVVTFTKSHKYKALCARHKPDAHKILNILQFLLYPMHIHLYNMTIFSTFAISSHFPFKWKWYVMASLNIYYILYIWWKKSRDAWPLYK